MKQTIRHPKSTRERVPRTRDPYPRFANTFFS
jgi:hypothetical protein